MKTKQTFLTFLMLLSIAFSYAQTSIDASGIAIQGIARDNNNTARINTSINLTFELYYNDSNSGNEVPIVTQSSASLTTDNFGVFSYVLVPGATNNAKMANNQVYLRIKEGTTVISDEELRHVPYAISANNGVPTGSIMPFVGTTAPTGWVLCNNQDLTNVNGAENLIALIGNNAPDLRGMFLRGIGRNSENRFDNVTNERTGVVGTTQDDANLSHLHSVNLTTGGTGAHQHATRINNRPFQISGNTGNNSAFYAGVSVTGTSTMLTETTGANSSTGAHAHNVSGNTAAEGTESRPINFGVNYIIKL